MQYADVVVVVVVLVVVAAVVVVVIVAFVVRNQYAERWLVAVVDCYLPCQRRTNREEMLLKVRCRHWRRQLVCLVCLKH